MALGTLGGLVSGLSEPSFNVLFGILLDDLNSENANFIDKVNFLCIMFVVVSGFDLISGFLQVCISHYCAI